MSAHLMTREVERSQIDAERRAARIRLCATAPRDSRSAGIGGWPDEAAVDRIDRYLVALAVLAAPIALYALYVRI